MSTINSLNFIHIVKDNLERIVKDEITERLVETQMKDFESKIRPEIEKLVLKLSFDSIEHVRDMARLRDDFKVYLNWPEDKSIDE